MTKPLTETERKLAATLLHAASDVFGNKGCNDFPFDKDFYGYDIPKMSREERRELVINMERHNGDKEELARLEALPPEDHEFDYTHDFGLMTYLAARLDGEV